MFSKRSKAKSRPPGHSDRPSRSAAEFAEQFFGSSVSETAAALAVYRSLAKHSDFDISGLEPDDCLGELVRGPDSLDRIEAVMGIELEEGTPERQIAEETLDRHYWQSILESLLGSAASACTWDPRTLADRSIAGVVAEIVRRG